MANENETHEEVCEKMDNESGEYHIDDYGLSSYEIGLYKERILAAHKREIRERDAEIVAKAIIIDAKDAIIKELADALNSYLKGECIDCGVCQDGGACVHQNQLRSLVAKAREAVK